MINETIIRNEQELWQWTNERQHHWLEFEYTEEPAIFPFQLLWTDTENSGRPRVFYKRQTMRVLIEIVQKLREGRHL